MESKASKRVQDIQERCLELAEVTRQRESAQVIQLPLWPEGKRGTPNSFIRSALFAAIQSKDRVYLQGVILASHKKITIKFTGLQLNQEDLTLWETLVHLARSHPLGNLCSFSGHEILKALKLSTGGEQHKRLHTAITRLNACSVEITHDGKTYFGSLIEGGIKDEITSHYTIELNQKLIRLFGESQWTAIDWQQRLQLRRKPLAQALHAHYSSHYDPHPVKLPTLLELTGSRNTQAADFKRKTKAALNALVEIGFLQSYEIGSDLVSVKRALVALSSKRKGTSLEP
jgi:TrfA protein